MDWDNSGKSSIFAVLTSKKLNNTAMDRLVKLEHDFVINNCVFKVKNGIWRIYKDHEELEDEYESIEGIGNCKRFFIIKAINKEYSNLLDCSRLRTRISSYKIIKFYREDRILVENQDFKRGFITLQICLNSMLDSESEIIPCVFDAIMERDDGLFDVRRNNSWGLMDLEGRIKAPISFNHPIRKDFKTFSGLLIEEATESGDSNFSYKLNYKSLGVYKYDNGQVFNLVPPLYSHIWIPRRRSIGKRMSNGEYVRRAMSNCGFVFCGVGNYVHAPLDDEEGYYASEDGFIDCYTFSGEKLSSRYQYYEITYDGNYIFAGRDGNFCWEVDEDCLLYFSSFSGVYDMINNEGNIIFKDIIRFYYTTLDKNNNHFIALLKIAIETEIIWVLLEDGNKIIKSGLRPLRISPSIMDQKNSKLILPYAIEFRKKDLQDNLIMGGLTEKGADDWVYWILHCEYSEDDD